jgi:hypothetical protein
MKRTKEWPCVVKAAGQGGAEKEREEEASRERTNQTSVAESVRVNFMTEAK